MFLACACLPALTVLFCHACRPCGLVPAVGIVLPLRVAGRWDLCLRFFGACALAGLALWWLVPPLPLCARLCRTRALWSFGLLLLFVRCFCWSAGASGCSAVSVVCCRACAFQLSVLQARTLGGLCRPRCDLSALADLVAWRPWCTGLGLGFRSFGNQPEPQSFSFCERLNAPGGLEAPSYLFASHTVLLSSACAWTCPQLTSVPFRFLHIPYALRLRWAQHCPLLGLEPQ